MKDWLTSESTLKIIGVIDEVIHYDVIGSEENINLKIILLTCFDLISCLL